MFTFDGYIRCGSTRGTVSIKYTSTDPKEVAIFEDGSLDDPCYGEFETLNSVQFAVVYYKGETKIIDNVKGSRIK